MNLDEFKFRKKLRNKDIADGIGCSETYVIYLRQGINKPSRKMMKKITEFTNGEVQPNDFYNTPTTIHEAIQLSNK